MLPPYDARFLPWEERCLLSILQTDPSNIGGSISLHKLGGEEVVGKILDAPFAPKALEDLISRGVLAYDVERDVILVPAPMRNVVEVGDIQGQIDLREKMVVALNSLHPSFRGWALDQAIQRCNDGRAEPSAGPCEVSDAVVCLRCAMEAAAKPNDGGLHCKVMEIFSPRNWAETQRRFLGRSIEEEASRHLTNEDARSVAKHFKRKRSEIGGRPDRITTDFRSAVFALGRKGYTRDDIERVISAKVEQAKKNPEAVKWVNWPTLLNPENFARSLSMLNATGEDDDQARRHKSRDRNKVDRRPSPVSVLPPEPTESKNKSYESDRVCGVKIGPGDFTKRSEWTLEEAVDRVTRGMTPGTSSTMENK